MEIILLVIVMALFPIATQEPTRSSWIIWNVGQGEWVTHVSMNTCEHFDMGGEHWPKRAIQKTCGQKQNLAHFSHWDLDHVGFAKKARSALAHLCLAKTPLGKASRSKQRLLEGLERCLHSTMQIWQPPLPRTRKRSSNESSQIFFTSQTLITGDAPKEEERLFLNDKGKFLHKVRWLVLGHHGSRTSTSDELLKALPSLTLAIASARQGKYGHPHSEVLRRLRAFGVPVLSTEDWGSIEIEE